MMAVISLRIDSSTRSSGYDPIMAVIILRILYQDVITLLNNES
jgi:hypothetical protein